MKMFEFKKFAKKTMIALCVIICLFSFFAPSFTLISSGETYRCIWSDGNATTESYSSAYDALHGVNADGVILYRNGKSGKIELRDAELYAALEEGSLDELLNARSQKDETRIERAAFYRVYSKRIWYDGDFFVWNGNSVARVARATGDELILLNGGISSRTLQDTGVKTVHLRPDAKITATTFSASCVKNVYAQPPYRAYDGAIYLSTAGGKRLLSALGTVKALTLDGDLRYADEGALLACTGLESLTLPFVGSAADGAGSTFRSELSYLFSDGKQYCVPASLKHVKVTGGTLDAYAFYRCENLSEIDACGVAEQNISASAFNGLPSLQTLHSPKKVLLSGFASSPAPCGCTVYTKITP